MTKVLLVDDHQMVLDGFASLLESEPDIEVVGKCLNAGSALEAIGQRHPDLVVLDLELEDGFDGIELLKLLKEQKHQPKVLVLSMYKTDAHITGVLQSGALGYIVKNKGAEELVDAIRTVESGKTYYSDEITEAIMESLRNPKPPKPKEPGIILTKREKEVLRLIIEGFTSQQIGEKLFIATSTVDSHRRNLIEKTAVKNSKELIGFAFKNGFV